MCHNCHKHQIILYLCSKLEASMCDTCAEKMVFVTREEEKKPVSAKTHREVILSIVILHSNPCFITYLIPKDNTSFLNGLIVDILNSFTIFNCNSMVF